MQPILTWGNPNLYQLSKISALHFLDSVFRECDKKFPLNSSEAVKSEIIEIYGKLKEIALPDNEKILQRFLSYDKSISQSMFNVLSKQSLDFNNEETKQIIEKIQEDVESLVLKLKFDCNRPRPYQLAATFGLNLFPYPSRTFGSPSFPSMNVVVAGSVLEVLSCLHPTHYEYLMKFYDDICDSRIYLGHNFPSDIDFSREVVDKIISHKDITTKYKI